MYCAARVFEPSSTCWHVLRDLRLTTAARHPSPPPREQLTAAPVYTPGDQRRMRPVAPTVNARIKHAVRPYLDQPSRTANLNLRPHGITETLLFLLSLISVIYF